MLIMSMSSQTSLASTGISGVHLAHNPFISSNSWLVADNESHFARVIIDTCILHAPCTLQAMLDDNVHCTYGRARFNQFQYHHQYHRTRRRDMWENS
jgi:hypothetical protein